MKTIKLQEKKGRIVAIDYGIKRVGIAVTDPLQLIVTPLTTLTTADVISFLMRYVQEEIVVAFVVGLPKHLNGRLSRMTEVVHNFIIKLKKKFSRQSILSYDERFTSKLARRSMIEGGFSKTVRCNKEYIDKVSAAIILQSFLSRTSNNYDTK